MTKNPIMKKHLSTIVFGCLGVCAGFTLCYVYVVIPQREASLATPTPLQTTEPWTTTVTIARDGSLYLGDARIETDQLRTILTKNAAQDKPIVIRAAKNTDFAAISAILDACKTAGLHNVGFARATTE